MEEQQNQNQEEQPEVAIEQPKKTIPTQFGSLIILLIATIAGAGVWWYAGSYTPPKVVNVGEVVEQLQERRETKKELPEEYEIKADGVYYEGGLIEEADSQTFQHIKWGYAKDKDQVFVFGYVLWGIDSATVEYIDEEYIEDKNGVYLIIETRNARGENYSCPVTIITIEDVDKGTFVVSSRESGFSWDKNNSYYYGKVIIGANSDTFEPLDHYFSRDAEHLFFETNVVEGADPETFEYVNWNYTKDKNYISYKGEKMKILNISSSEYIHWKYTKDKNNVYECGKIVEGANPANCTAENLEGCKGPVKKNELPEEYEIKADGVYYKGELIDGADPKTFEILEDVFSRDKNNVYYANDRVVVLEFYLPESFKYLGENYFKGIDVWGNTEICYYEFNPSGSISYDCLDNVDFESFEILGEGYSRDLNNVYYEYRILYFADPKTITVNPDGTAKDKNFSFHKTTLDVDENLLRTIEGLYYTDGTFVYEKYYDTYYPIMNADPETFEHAGMCSFVEKSRADYTKDKNYVFCGGGIIEEADPKTFETVGVIECDGMPAGTTIARDATHVYFGSILLEGIDPATLVIVSDDYIKDKDHVYLPRDYFGNNNYALIVEDADVLTFEDIEGTRYAKDKDRVFAMYNGEVYITGADPADCTIDSLDMCEPEDFTYGHACLASGTKISMADGKYKNIENIKVGDFVTSYNIETKEYKISKVDKVIKRKDPLVIINNTLRAAPDEPVYLADGSIKEVIDIKVGDYLINEKGGQVKVDTIENNTELVDTYDFTLENGDNFFADGYLVGTPDLQKVE